MALGVGRHMQHSINPRFVIDTRPSSFNLNLAKKYKTTLTKPAKENAPSKAVLGEYYRERGMEFEKLAVGALSSYGFSLKQRNVDKTQADAGVDLVGQWSFAPRCVVTAQCKRLNASVAIRAVRELESSTRRYQNQAHDQCVIGLLATGTDLSPAAKQWFTDSDTPLAIALILPHRPLCHFHMNPTMSSTLPELRVVRQFNHKYACFADIIVRTHV